MEENKLCNKRMTCTLYPKYSSNGKREWTVEQVTISRLSIGQITSTVDCYYGKLLIVDMIINSNQHINSTLKDDDSMSVWSVFVTCIKSAVAYYLQYKCLCYRSRPCVLNLSLQPFKFHLYFTSEWANNANQIVYHATKFNCKTESSILVE